MVQVKLHDFVARPLPVFVTATPTATSRGFPVGRGMAVRSSYRNVV